MARSSRSRSSTSRACSRRSALGSGTRPASSTRPATSGELLVVSGSSASGVWVLGEVAGGAAQSGLVSGSSTSMSASSASPASGRAMHSARNSVAASGPWPRSAARPAAPPGPEARRARAVAGTATAHTPPAEPPPAQQRRQPTLGQLQRPATRRTSSSRRTLAGSSEHRAQLGQRPVAALGAARVGALEDPLDLEDDERHRAARPGRAAPRRRRARSGPPGRCPSGSGTTRSSSSRPAASRAARSIASWPAAVGVETQLEHLTTRSSSPTCSSVSDVPMIPTALRSPAWCRASTSV